MRHSFPRRWTQPVQRHSSHTTTNVTVHFTSSQTTTTRWRKIETAMMDDAHLQSRSLLLVSPSLAKECYSRGGGPSVGLGSTDLPLPPLRSRSPASLRLLFPFPFQVPPLPPLAATLLCPFVPLSCFSGAGRGFLDPPVAVWLLLCVVGGRRRELVDQAQQPT